MADRTANLIRVHYAGPKGVTDDNGHWQAKHHAAASPVASADQQPRELPSKVTTVLCPNAMDVDMDGGRWR